MNTMELDSLIAQALVEAFVAGPLDADELVRRGVHLLGRRWRWLRPLAMRICATFAGRTRPRRCELLAFILKDRGFRLACENHELELRRISNWQPEMEPVAATRGWALPSICSARELADWLEVTIGELDWFSDRRSLEYKQNRGRLRHYHYRVLCKRFGQVRLIEAPKPRLKTIQRRILDEILNPIPVHQSVHGFCRGRSISSFAAPHVGQHVVLRIDLKNFFPSIGAARIQALFRTIGYPEGVADLLTGLCTNATPLDVWDVVSVTAPDLPMCHPRFLYARPHLPQGAPTSPALANLCAYRTDCRLSGLAVAANAVYTRYADDLAFSGDHDFARGVERFAVHVAATLLEEGFQVNHRKTRIMRQGVRQYLAGIVVNERLNVVRADYDRMKAVLTNCLRHGPASQNRDHHQDFRAHLNGQISFVESINPAKGSRLRRLFDQIGW